MKPLSGLMDILHLLAILVHASDGEKSSINKAASKWGL
jgi:hypothetical protein